MASLLLASLLWSVSFGLIKDTLSGYDPRVVAAARLVLAALVFSPWLGRAMADRRARLGLMALGSVQFGLMYMLYIASYATLPAHAVALFTVLTPLYVIFLEDLAARRASRRGLALALLAAAGGAGIVWHGLPDRAGWRGILLLQGANLCFAFGQVAYRRWRRGNGAAAADVGSLAWMYLGAAVFSGLIAWSGVGLTSQGFDRRAFAALLYLGLLPTGVGFWLWNRGAVSAPATLMAVLNNAKIPLAVLLAWLLFGEPVDFVRFAPGAAIVFSAAVAASFSPRKSD